MTLGKRKAREENTALQQEEAAKLLKVERAHQQHLKQQGIRAGLKIAESACADKAIANFFYANGLPFHCADPSTDSYYKEMVRAIQQAPSGYNPPNRLALAGNLLDELHGRMWDELMKKATGNVARKFGVSYTSDGWDSVTHLPLINSAFISADSGGMYFRSVDTSGMSKTAEYVAALMIDDIYSFGCTNVILVVTDTCNTMQKAWSYVQDEFPWITCIPCVPHVVLLLMKDVAN